MMSLPLLDNVHFPLLWGWNKYDSLKSLCLEARRELADCGKGLLLPKYLVPAALLGALPRERWLKVIATGLCEADCVCILALRIIVFLFGKQPDFCSILHGKESLIVYLRSCAHLGLGDNLEKLGKLVTLGRDYGNCHIFEKFCLNGIYIQDMKVDSCLGRGAVSIVFRVKWGREICALKMPLVDYDQRFKAETSLLARMHHQAMPKIYSLSALENGKPGILMECLDTARTNIVAHGKNGFAEGLDYLHSKHILHGDIRLANLGLRNSSNGVLFDFSHSRQGQEFSSELARAEKKVLYSLFEA